MAKAGKKVKTCNRCGAQNLAWHRTETGWALYEGHHVDGAWQANTDRPHKCGGAEAQGEDRPAEAKGPQFVAGDDVVALGCGCGYVVQANREDVLKFGYPVCPACTSFMVVGEGVELRRAKDFTPETVEV